VRVRELNFTMLKKHKDVLDEIRDRGQTAAVETKEYFPSVEARAKEMSQAGHSKSVSRQQKWHRLRLWVFGSWHFELQVS